MNKIIFQNTNTNKKARIISNQQIAYDLLEMQEILTLPINTCLYILYDRLSTNNLEATC